MQATLKFLKNLKENNDKVWFGNHKDEYLKVAEEFLFLTELLISKIEKFDKSIKGISAKNCIFRIYRDVRFAKDKSPFKTNFGAFIKQGGKNSPGAGYYIHIEPEKSMLGGGIYMPPSDVLFKIRNSILKDSKPLKKILKDKEFQKTFGEIYKEDKLKTAPRGIPKDHPDLDLLTHKHYTIVKTLSDKEVTSKNFTRDAEETFNLMRPFNFYLNSII